MNGSCIRNFTYMIKNYFLSICLLFLSFSACKDEEVFNGIFVTGDYTTVLSVWNGEKNGTMNVANFQDSSKITYPAYWLSITEKYAVFSCQAEGNSDKVSYFCLEPSFEQNNKDILELKNLKFVFARDIVAGIELVGVDETKSVILNGKIEKK